MNDLSRSSPSKPCRGAGLSLISLRYSREEETNGITHAIHSQNTDPSYECVVAAFFPPLQKKWLDSITATLHFPIGWAQNRKKIPESFFKRVVSAVINRLGKFLGSTHNREGTKRKPFMSLHANPNEFEFPSPERWWRKRSHRQRNQQQLVNFGSYFLRKENWWYIQYISFIFPFFRVSFDGL